MPEWKQPVESGWTWMEEEVRRAMRTTGLTLAALALAEESGAEARDAQCAFVGRLRNAVFSVGALGPEAVMA
jgi:hypothetical protein